jgi:hypothetical protein
LEDDIRERAHELSKHAGKSENREEEFWHLADKSYAAWIDPRCCALPTTFGEYFCSRSIFEDIEQYRKVRHQNLSGSKRPDFTTARSRGLPDAQPDRVSLIEWAGIVMHPNGRWFRPLAARRLPLHRIDLGEICRDQMIAAALAGHHLKTTVHEG